MGHEEGYSSGIGASSKYTASWHCSRVDCARSMTMSAGSHTHFRGGTWGGVPAALPRSAGEPHKANAAQQTCAPALFLILNEDIPLQTTFHSYHDYPRIREKISHRQIASTRRGYPSRPGQTNMIDLESFQTSFLSTYTPRRAHPHIAPFPKAHPQSLHRLRTSHQTLPRRTISMSRRRIIS